MLVSAMSVSLLLMLSLIMICSQTTASELSLINAPCLPLPPFLSFLSVSFQFHGKFMIASIVNMDAIRIDFVENIALSSYNGEGLTAE